MAGPRIDDSEVLAAAVEELADEATVGLDEAVAAAEVATEEVSAKTNEPEPSSATLSNPRQVKMPTWSRIRRPLRLPLRRRRNPKVV